jgi:hypothetical protein
MSIVPPIAVLCAAALAGAAASGDPFEGRPGYRMRGAYLAVEDIRLVAPAAEAGMDTLLVGLHKVKAPLDADLRGQVVRWAAECQKHGLAFWPSFAYFGAYEVPWIGAYRRYVDGDGQRYDHTPCPLDAGFWQRSVEARCLALAELSRDCPIAGIALDTEMYAADKGGVSQTCYCGDCIARTLRAAGRDVAPPYPERRRAWLTEIALLDAHFQTMREALRALAEHTRDRVAQVAPDLLLGAFNIDEAVPPMQGILLGWGQPGRPVYAFSEATYVPGYTPYVPQTQQRLERLGAQARMIVGVWQSKFPARVLAAQLYECARNSAGYWVYTFETFDRPGYCPLPDKAEDYWAAMRRANEELDRLARDPDYVTSLKIEPFLLPIAPLSTRGVERLSLKPLLPATEQALPPAQWRKNNILYVYATAGRRTSLSVRLMPGASSHEGGQYVLVSPDGRVLARSDLLEADTPVAVEFDAEQTGVYAIAIGAGWGSIKAEGRQPYAVAANPDSPAQLYIVIPTLYLLARPGQRQVTLQMGVMGEAERVRVAVMQGNRVCYADVLATTRTVVVPVDPTAESGILKIEVLRVPGAVRESFSIAVVKGAYPLVAVSPEGLLRD